MLKNISCRIYTGLKWFLFLIGLLAVVLYITIRSWSHFGKRDPIIRPFLSTFSEENLRYNFTLPKEKGDFIVKIESSTPQTMPQTYFKRAMIKAFPEYNIVYTTDIYSSPHMIFRGINPSKWHLREFYNLVPYFISNIEPDHFTEAEHRVTGRPFMVANDHIQYPYDNTHEFIPLAGQSYSDISGDLYNHQTNHGRYKNIRARGIAYINSACHPHRDKMFFLLKERLPGQVHALGKCPLNYKKDRIDIPPRADGYDKLTSTYENYNFVFAMENAKVHGYISEKILNSYYGGAIPIYWGESQMARRFFNPESYIDIDSFNSFEEAADYIASVYKSKEATEKYLNAPMFLDNDKIDPYLRLEEERITPEVEKIIDAFAKRLRTLYFEDIAKRKNYRNLYPDTRLGSG